MLREAEALVGSGVKELLVVSQDTSAYGLDVRYAAGEWRGEMWRSNLEELSRGTRPARRLGADCTTSYPYPHVDAVIPLMAEGLTLPYLDIPFQHAAPQCSEGHAPPRPQ